jgi:hypothetical protein
MYKHLRANITNGVRYIDGSRDVEYHIGVLNFAQLGCIQVYVVFLAAYDLSDNLSSCFMSQYIWRCRGEVYALFYR